MYYVGDIGTQIVVNCGVDISSATNTKLKVKKPDETIVEWVATISGTNNLTYTTISGDLDQSGEYKLQALLTQDGWTGHGDVATFDIYDLFTS